MDLNKAWEEADPQNNLQQAWDDAADIQSAEVYSGWVKGMRDPVDALAQILYNTVPEKVRRDMDAFNNWIAEKTGLLEKIPEGGFNELLRQQEEKYQRGRIAEGDTGVDWDRLGGSVFTSMIPGAMSVKTLAPTSFLGKVGTGAAMGAGYSQLTPVTEGDFFEEKLKQAKVGAVTGAAIPAAIELGKTGTKLVDELTRPMKWRNTGKGLKSGIAKDTRDYLNEIASEDKEAILLALKNAKKGETVGQTLARAGVGTKFIKLEQEIAKRAPSDQAQEFFRSQETVRKNIINAIAGSDEDLATAYTMRAIESSRNYTKAYEQAIKGDSKLVELSKNPFFKKAIPDAVDLAKANKVDPKKNLTEFLHYVKVGIDKQLSKKGDDALIGMQRDAANTARKDLIKWLKDKNKLYDVARAKHAELSQPINQMEVGRELQKGLITSTEKESAAPFLTAKREAPRTIKRATGQSIYDKLSDILTPEQVKGVEKVADELVNMQRYKDIGAKTKSPYGVLTEEAKLQIAPMLERNVMIANAMLRRLGRRATPEYEKVAWGIMKDPNEMIKLLSKPDSDKKKQLLLNVIREMSISASAQAGDK